MDEPIDAYCDQFQVNTGAYGCAINFNLTSPVPPVPGAAPEFERVATIRMSMEHLKTMTFILRRQILQQESETGVSYDLPQQVLNALRISHEDWDSFWRYV